MRVLGLHPQILVFAALEAAVCFGAPYVAAGIRFDESIAAAEAEIGPLWPRGVLFASTMLLGLVSVGLYSARQRAGAAGTLVRVGVGTFAAFVLIVIVYYLAPGLHIGRGVLGLTLVIGFCACLFTRALMSKIVDAEIFKRRVLVYGAGVRAASIARLRRRTDQRGFRIIGYISSHGDAAGVACDKPLMQTGSLLQLCRSLAVDEIVVAMDDRRGGLPVKDLLNCRMSNIRVIELESFLERETGKVRLDVLNASWMIFGSGFCCTGVRKITARSFDVIASLLLLMLAWPIMLITALAIKLEDGIRAPVVYRQTRVGLHGRHFGMLKFRSMRVDAEQDGQPRWCQKGDRRVTRVGAVARIFRVDELPQLLNVLLGDMRFVGPRPERPEFVESLSRKIPYYRERHCVKPGITGWAQLYLSYGASEQAALEKLEYDLYYAKNHCLLLDLSILLQTAEVIVWRKGAQ